MSDINDTILLGLIAQLQYKVARLEGKSDAQARDIARNMAMAAIAAASGGRSTVHNTLMSSVEQAMNSAISLLDALEAE
jgi:hypothetical protein